MSALVIVKKDGRRQPFDRQKLRASIETACAKRPISAGNIEQIWWIRSSRALRRA